MKFELLRIKKQKIRLPEAEWIMKFKSKRGLIILLTSVCTGSNFLEAAYGSAQRNEKLFELYRDFRVIEFDIQGVSKVASHSTRKNQSKILKYIQHVQTII